MIEKTGGDKPPDKNPVEMDMVSTIKDINSFDLNNKYKHDDKGPYFVYVEHMEKNFGRLFPMRIGYFLMCVEEIKNDILDIVSVGINRVKVIFKTFSIANSLVNHETMKKNNLVAYIPKFFNHRKGVIKMVDTHFTEEYLNNAIECDIAEVASVQRMKRKITGADGNVQLVNRQIIIVTFVGNNLPEKIRINLSYFTVEPYVHPVVQCFKCLRYGHTTKLCKAKEQRCKKCSQTHDISDSCSDPNAFCIYCQNSDHSSVSKSCPMFTKQHNIKKVMAKKNISFKEAQTIVNNPSYAKITTNNRFDILKNYENFPPLQQNNSNSQGTATPTVAKPNISQSTPKKRKAVSPPQTPLTLKKTTIKKTNKPIIPNPYRDEFMEYKEKIIDQISNFVTNYLKTQVLDKTNTEENSDKFREYIDSIFNLANYSGTISISDDEESDF